jgi:hypothetical protein
MLKHYSHIRMEAKRTALESIVKKPADKDASVQQNGQTDGSPQKSLHRLQNGARQSTSSSITTRTENSAGAKKNGTALLRLADDYAAF